MSLKKQFLKSKPVCKVTFNLDAELVGKARKVSILGDFNDWDPRETNMRKLKNGSFTKTMDLEVGKDYQFRYLVDGTKWMNDTEADKYVPSGMASEENGVVSI